MRWRKIMKTDVISGKIEVRFGWESFPRQYSGGLLAGLMNKPMEIDCDASAVFLNRDKRPVSKEMTESVLNYQNSRMFDEAALHLGDNTKGELADDEVIVLDLDRIPGEVETIAFTLDLFKEKKRLESGTVQNTFVRIIIPDSGDEVCRSDFCSLNSGMKLAVCGFLHRAEKGWTFEAGQDSYNANDMKDALERFS